MRTSKNSVPLIPLKDFGSSPFLEHGIFIEAFEDCVSVRHKRLEVHRHDYVELFWLDGAWQVGVTYCLKHGIETSSAAGAETTTG